MTEYIQLLISSLASTLKFGALGLVMAIAILFLLNKYKLLERENLFLQIFTKLYFFIIPLSFFMFFWLGSATWRTVSLYEKELQTAIVQVEESSYPLFMAFIDENVKSFVEQDELPTNREIVKLFLTENTDKTQSKTYKYALRECLVLILEFTIGKDDEGDRRISALSQGLAKKAFDKGFDYIKETTSKQMKGLLMAFLMPLLITFIIVLAIPTIEIVVSNQSSNKAVE